MNNNQKSGLIGDDKLDYEEIPSPIEGGTDIAFKPPPIQETVSSGESFSSNSEQQVAADLSLQIGESHAQTQLKIDDVRRELGIEKRKMSKFAFRSKDGRAFDLEMPRDPTIIDVKDALKAAGADDLADQAHSIHKKSTLADRAKRFVKDAARFAREEIGIGYKDMVYTTNSGEKLHIRLPSSPGIEDVKRALIRAGREDLAEQAYSINWVNE